MNRRSFISAAAATGTAAWLSQSFTCAATSEKLTLAKDDVILFQGDSITDAGRDRKQQVANQGLGRGYPSVIAAALRSDYPELNLQIHNRGISGNKVPDLAKRWDVDCIAIKPRILSILIGVNDIWHRLAGRYDGTAEVYRDGFTELLQRTKAALPDVTLVVCDPFVLMSGTVKQNKDKWFPEFDTRRKFAKEVSDKAEAIWVPFQKAFDEAVANGTSPGDLAGDGVHPTPAGHQLMADTWRKAVGI